MVARVQRVWVGWILFGCVVRLLVAKETVLFFVLGFLQGVGWFVGFCLGVW